MARRAGYAHRRRFRRYWIAHGFIAQRLDPCCCPYKIGAVAGQAAVVITFYVADVFQRVGMSLVHAGQGGQESGAVIARAENDQHVTAKGVAERCRLESGNFFEAVPKGGDAYIMKYILHDWNDDECVKILANCRAAMNENGKVLVVDNVVSAGNNPSWGKLLDMQMLIIGGRERTKEEFGALFAAAGLKLTRIVPTTRIRRNCIMGITQSP